MKTTLIIILIIASLTCVAQSHIGQTEKVAYKSIIESGLFYMKTKFTDKKEYYKFFLNDSTEINITCHFDKNNYCFYEKINYPVSMMKDKIHEYNKSMFTISKGHWEYFTKDNDYVSCELILVEDYFTVIFKKIN